MALLHLLLLASASAVMESCTRCNNENDCGWMKASASNYYKCVNNACVQTPYATEGQACNTTKCLPSLDCNDETKVCDPDDPPKKVGGCACTNNGECRLGECKDSVCTSYFTVAAGQACTHMMACIPPASCQNSTCVAPVCEPACTGTATCTGPNKCTPTCTGEQWLDEESNTCKNAIAQGEACESSEHCTSTAPNCYAGKCQTYTRAPLGAECNPSGWNPCAAGGYCDNKVCVALKKEGEACSSVTECAKGLACSMTSMTNFTSTCMTPTESKECTAQTDCIFSGSYCACESTTVSKCKGMVSTGGVYNDEGEVDPTDKCRMPERSCREHAFSALYLGSRPLFDMLSAQCKTSLASFMCCAGCAMAGHPEEYKQMNYQLLSTVKLTCGESPSLTALAAPVCTFGAPAPLTCGAATLSVSLLVLLLAAVLF